MVFGFLSLLDIYALLSGGALREYKRIYLLFLAAPALQYDDRLKAPQALREGQKLVIDAKITGVPASTSAWSFNGQPLQADKSVSFEATQSSAKLTITDAKAKQAGTYTLKAENSVGATLADFVISVKGNQIAFSFICYSMADENVDSLIVNVMKLGILFLIH